MFKKNITVKVIAVILTALFFLPLGSAKAEAAYSIGFQTETVQVTSPSANNLQYDRSFTIAGTSSLRSVWVCLRGPAGEITTYPITVYNGSFSKEIWLRFGAGTYTVWVGDNNKQFDGRIRFEVQNTSTDDYFNLTPSGLVNSDNKAVINLANSLTTDSMTEMQKVKAIHSWVTKNIKYDTQAYYAGKIGNYSATDVINRKLGTCRDYSFAFAALCRASGIETRVVYGNAWSSSQKKYELHAWNEVNVDGEWLSVDTTWDAGYIKNSKFVVASTSKYIGMNPATFNKTHQLTKVTLY
ncbi:transglutaminase-like domain-containing protein [Dehalobacter sp. DCM]|uniref:transglutaminase domain-containing protein n=1 Tax=Dehalobacter sp. DCM TaxID=2907827 RepID=UPI003081F280|nr:transglutaminase-like domain-containing protein [Dehalobacter sp. DCM]